MCVKTQKFAHDLIHDIFSEQTESINESFHKKLKEQYGLILLHSSSYWRADYEMSKMDASNAWRRALRRRYGQLAQQTLLQQRHHFLQETQQLSQQFEPARDLLRYKTFMEIRMKDMQCERYHREVEHTEQRVHIMIERKELNQMCGPIQLITGSIRNLF